MWDWLSEAIDTLSVGAKDLIGGISTAIEWVSGSDLPDGASSVADTFNPADAARLGADGGMFGLPTGETAGGVSALAASAGGSAAKEGVWTTEGLKKMLGDLGGWAEKNPKSVVALGSAAAALLKRNESNMTNEILRSHYASQDATAAGKLALEQQAQQNALTSGHNLNVNGLPARRVNGLIQSNVDIPGGFDDRSKRNRNFGATA